MTDHYVWCNVAGFSHGVQRPSCGRFCKCSLTSLEVGFELVTAAWKTFKSPNSRHSSLVCWYNQMIHYNCMLYMGRQCMGDKILQWSFWFFRYTMIYTLIEEDSKRVSTNIDTTAAFAWQRLVLCFPYMKEILDLKTLRLQMLIWHNGKWLLWEHE